MEEKLAEQWAWAKPSNYRISPLQNLLMTSLFFAYLSLGGPILSVHEHRGLAGVGYCQMYQANESAIDNVRYAYEDRCQIIALPWWR